MKNQDLPDKRGEKKHEHSKEKEYLDLRYEDTNEEHSGVWKGIWGWETREELENQTWLYSEGDLMLHKRGWAKVCPVGRWTLKKVFDPGSDVIRSSCISMAKEKPGCDLPGERW